MQHEGMEPNIITFMSMVKACSITAAFNEGKLIHTHIIECGSELNTFVGNTLISFYAKCRSLKDAHGVFKQIPQRDVVTWSALIAGYAQHGNCSEALQLFQQMQQEGVEPNNVTFVSILKACSNTEALEQGKLLHAQIIDKGLEADLCIGTSLIDMYAERGSIEDGCRVFEKSLAQDVVMWNAIVAVYTQNGSHHQVLGLFQQMLRNGREPDHVTCVNILEACSSTAALDLGRLVHALSIKSGFEGSDIIGSGLINMYANCGRLTDSCRVFDNMPKRNVVTWNAMIAGYALHSNQKVALEYFGVMQKEGLKPNHATFVCILTVCSHMGLVEKGNCLFASMREDYELTPALEHYTCVIDLLGHVGCLYEAEDLLQTMPCQPNPVGWRSLFHHCKTYCSVEQGKRCFDHVIRMEYMSASEYMVMSNIYAGAHMWDDATKIQKLRHFACMWKEPGAASIVIGNKVHDFIVGVKSHPQSDAINAKLCVLKVQLKIQGHVPFLDLILH